jgi:hypothetical protein
MAATYIPIASTTLSSDTASVTFSAIAANYTDLVLRCSARSSKAANILDNLKYEFNSSTSNFSATRILGSGSAGSSNRVITNTSQIRLNASTSTSNTFTNFELYISNYAASIYKPFSVFSALENNATEAYLAVIASLWSNTDAITSIKLSPEDGPDFLSGSTFHLYGISNT